MKTGLMSLIAFTILFTLNQATAAEKLFKDYVYGSQYDAFANKEGYYDCSAEIQAQALCIDDTSFAGHDFTTALIFSKNNLYMLSLIAEFDQERYVSTFGALANSFDLLLLSNSSSQLDLIELARTSRNQSEYAAKLNSYESVGLNASSLTYTFFEKPNKGKNHKNVTDVLKASADNIRTAEIMIQDNFFLVRFAFPNLETKRLLKSMSKPVESF